MKQNKSFDYKGTENNGIKGEFFLGGGVIRSNKVFSMQISWLLKMSFGLQTYYNKSYTQQFLECMNNVAETLLEGKQKQSKCETAKQVPLYPSPSTKTLRY